MSDLERRELQPLREHLEELGEKALPAIEEWAKANGYALVHVHTLTWAFPVQSVEGAGGGASLGGVLRIVGTDRTTPNETPVDGIPVWGAGWSLERGGS